MEQSSFDLENGKGVRSPKPDIKNTHLETDIDRYKRLTAAAASEPLQADMLDRQSPADIPPHFSSPRELCEYIARGGNTLRGVSNEVIGNINTLMWQHGVESLPMWLQEVAAEKKVQVIANRNGYAIGIYIENFKKGKVQFNTRWIKGKYKYNVQTQQIEKQG